MHKLLRISDLQSLPVDKRAVILKEVHQLTNTYYNFIKNHNHTFTFEVKIFADETREAGIHASEVSGCFRRFVYALMNTEKVTKTSDVNMKMRFRLGHAIHAMVQNDWHTIAEQSGGRIMFEDEVRIHPSMGGPAALWNLHSSCDGIITICKQEEGAWTPWIRSGMEIKTESGPQFEDLKSPRDYHEEQVCIYQKALDLPLMWTFYYNKSNSNITASQPPWVFEFDQTLWESLEVRFVMAMQRAETNTLPDREEGMPCRWCAFSWHCNPKILKRKRGTMPLLSRSTVGNIRR